MSPIQVLIVEDEQLVADDLRETLEDLGYNVVGLTATGEEAIIDAESLLPDLVLMDIRLAGEMDGITAANIIQSRLNIPIVYLTANADHATLERVKATQPFGYILKPFNEKILATTIEIALSRHAAEVEVQKALEAAQEDKKTAEYQSNLKSQYLCIAAHEFRNPLTAIKLGTEILKQYGHKLPDQNKQIHLDRIASATESLNDLLDSILTLGKAEVGKLDFHPEPLNLGDFCQRLINSLQINLTKQHSLQFTVDGEFTVAYLDKKILWHLLNNLLSNAIKYSPRGGVVSLKLYREENHFCFQIQDQGIGIPPEIQSQIFTPFERGKNVGQIPGTGLGLAIVKQCVDVHGGEITINSVVGQGTTFIVKLPELLS
jgi:signal transduction histidine kinase